MFNLSLRLSGTRSASLAFSTAPVQRRARLTPARITMAALFDRAAHIVDRTGSLLSDQGGLPAYFQSRRLDRPGNHQLLGRPAAARAQPRQAQGAPIGTCCRPIQHHSRPGADHSDIHFIAGDKSQVARPKPVSTGGSDRQQEFAGCQRITAGAVQKSSTGSSRLPAGPAIIANRLHEQSGPGSYPPRGRRCTGCRPRLPGPGSACRRSAIPHPPAPG